MRKRAAIERKPAGRVEVLNRFGYVERISGRVPYGLKVVDEGRQRLGWMDGVQVDLG